MSRNDLAAICSEGDYDRVRELLAAGADPVTSRAGYFNWSPLHYTAQQGRLDFAKTLITHYRCQPQVEDKEGRTPLHISCQHGHLDFIRYLIKQKRCDPDYLDIENQTPLHHACGWLSECTDERALEVSRFLVGNAKCDPNGKDVNGKNGVLHTCEKGFLLVLKYFIEELKCSLTDMDYKGNNALHLAVSFSNNFEVVKYIIDRNVLDLKCVNNQGNNILHMAAVANSSLDICRLILDSEDSNVLVNSRNVNNATPLDLAKPELFRLILTRFQVKDEKLYNKYALSLGIKPHLDARVRIFVVGDSNSGKTAVIRSLQKETQSSFCSSFSLSFSSQTHISPPPTPSTPELTVSHFENKLFGNVVFYDFENSSEVECTQQVMLQNLVHPIFSIFIIVVDFSKTAQEINTVLHQSLTLLTRSCNKIPQKLKVLIVGSHASILKLPKSLKNEGWKSISLDNFKSFDKFDITAKILVDSLKSEHSGISMLRKQISTLCDQMEGKNVSSFNASCLSTYLHNKLSSSLAVDLEAVLTDVQSYVCEEGPIFDVRFFLSDDPSILIQSLDTLNENGHILFLKDENNNKKSIIIVDVSELYSELIKISNYDQKLILLSKNRNQNLVAFSDLSTLFPGQDLDIISHLLAHFKLCSYSSDMRAENQAEKENRKFYIPGLLSNIPSPKDIWDFESQYDFTFGWRAEPVQSGLSFSLQSLHVILLGCFSVSMPFTNHKNLTLWKNGIHFRSTTFEVLIETSSEFVSLIMRAQKLNLPCFRYRSTVIKSIRESINNQYSCTKFDEFVMDPFDTRQYPLESRKFLTLFNLSNITSSILCGCPIVKSEGGVEMKLNELLAFEPYVLIGSKCLATFSKDGKHDPVSNDFLRSMAESTILCNAKEFEIFCSMLSLGATHPNADDMYSSLSSWHKRSKLTYEGIIQLLDEYSLINMQQYY